MSLHPSRGVLLAYDAGELRPPRMRAVARHLAGCPDCRRTLLQRRALRQAVVSVTSPTAPDLLARIEARRAAGEVILLPGESPAPSRRGRVRRTAVAAGVGLALIAGSAVAAVRILDLAPLPAWLGGGEGAAVEAPRSGIDLPVSPAGVEIALEGAGDRVILVVEPTDGDLLQVTTTGAGPAARFHLGIDRVGVSGMSAGEVRLAVPRAAPGPVRVSADGRELAVVQDGLVRLRGRAPAETGRASLAELRGPSRPGGMR